MVTNGGFVTQSVSDKQTLQNAGAPTDGVDAIQSLTSTASGGTFALSFTNPLNGRVAKTAAIAWNATKAAIAAALQALSNMPAAAVIGGGAATLDAGVVTIAFQGDLSGMVIPILVADNALATGGTVVPSTTTAGVEGSGRGAADKGDLLADTTTPKLYQNSGTANKPVWQKVGTQT